MIAVTAEKRDRRPWQHMLPSRRILKLQLPARRDVYPGRHCMALLQP